MLNSIVDAITFKSWRVQREATRRRNNYDTIKSMIVERHLNGFGGLVLDKKKYDAKDLECFKPPMYYTARTAQNEPVIFWRKELMTEEVGSPNPKPLSVVTDQNDDSQD